MPAKYRWWQSGIVYQVYPRSFQDSNRDGIGDLKGIAARLDYLVELGVDAVWVSPIFPSPMADFGYDVADYTDIDPMFGTLADFDALVAAAHARGLKIILDFVPNHTSDQHPWFVESRSSRDECEARLVHLARCEAGWRRAEQLGERVRRQRVDVRRGDAAVLLPRLSEGAAGPQLAQSGCARRDARGAALLARSRRRWLSRRCDPSPDRSRAPATTIRPIRTGAKASRRRAGSRASIRSTRRRRTTASPRCARWPTPTRTAC